MEPDETAASIWDGADVVVLAKRQEAPHSLTLAFAPSGEHLVITAGKVVKLWHVETETIVFEREFPAYVHSAIMSPDEVQLAVALDDHTSSFGSIVGCWGICWVVLGGRGGGAWGLVGRVVRAGWGRGRETVGELLGRHPHVHLAATDGGSWRTGVPGPAAGDGEALERARRAEALRRGGAGQDRPGGGGVTLIVAPQRAPGACGGRVEEKAGGRSLGRYTAGARSSWIVWSGTGPGRGAGPPATVRGVDRRESERLATCGFQLALSIPRRSLVSRGSVLGLGLERGSGKRRRAALDRRAQNVAASVDRDPPSRRRRHLSWVRLIKKVYESDPLLCPYCGAEMRIVAFVVEASSLRRLLLGVGLGPQEAEPLPRAPPGEGELVYEAVEG